MKKQSGAPLVGALILSAVVSGQTLTLGDAVERAQRLYPAVQVSRSQVDAAAASIRLARTAFLPRLDSIAQVNRATRNNIYGMLLQQPVISPISGPPVNENSPASVFGSAVGMLVDWEPFDFGVRRSRVELAEITRRRAEASAVRTQFEAASMAADAYLTVLAAQQTEKAAGASVERSRVLLTAVEALVRAELRPGADASMARAEFIAAQSQVVRSRQAIADAKAVLAGLTGDSPGSLVIHEGRLLLPAETPAETAAQVGGNPIAREQTAVIDEARARLKTLDNQWVPRFTIQGTTYARGTGARPDFTTLGGANGLAPTFYNWGLGFSVRFSILDQASIRAQQAEQAANVRTEESRYKLIVNDLETRRNRALASLEAAREIALLTPVQLESARAAASQAEVRYRTGLGPVTEVADAQRVVAQAEIDDALARLNVWRALLALRIAEGDLRPFVEEAAR
jgi:outer membrane protein